MESRMKHPAYLVPGAVEALQSVSKAAEKADVPAKTISLVHLRVSQINGCSICVDMHARGTAAGSETQERLLTVAAWRDTPYFTDAERAALALAEALTRIADKEDPVPDAVWKEAARHYGEIQLSGLLIAICATNMWNRLNVASRQVAGQHTW